MNPKKYSLHHFNPLTHGVRVAMDIQNNTKSIAYIPLGFLSWHGRLLESLMGPNGELPDNASEKFNHVIVKVFDGRNNIFHLLDRDDLAELVPRLSDRLFNPVTPCGNFDALRHRPYWVRSDCEHPLRQEDNVKNICFMAFVDVGKVYI